MEDILESLTEAQQRAVCYRDGPLLILAGPGSGKTRVVTHRIAHLLAESIPADQILALTFTNKAADEMRQRLDTLAPQQSVWMGTFHRFCARLLRQYAPLVGLAENYSIYDTDDSQKLLAEAVEESAVDLTHVSVEELCREISAAKSNLLTADQYVSRPGRALGSIVKQVYPVYQRHLLAANAVDFDDLLLHVAVLLRDNPELRRRLDDHYRHILVDEYQDTNFAQYAIVRAISQDFPNLAVTGDPDQSIYGWRGANLRNILDFEQDFSSVAVVRLEQNYRSTKSILRVADHLIAYNTRRKQKSLFTENPEGPPVRLITYPSGYDEAEHIAAWIADETSSGRYRPRDFAIFYRVNSLSRIFENSLHNAGIPYQIVRGLEFYQRKEIKDILAYLHLVNNPRSDVALRRIINTPPRSIGQLTIARLTEYASQKGLCLLDAARQAGLIESLAKRSAVRVAEFVAMFDRLSLLAVAPLEEIIGVVLSETGYAEWLQGSTDPKDQDRLANVKELLTDGREFDVQHPGQGHLEEFLERASLVSDTDEWELESDRVSLMTLHAAKGLEFPVVHVVALEEGLLPHERSREDPDKLEEERRLLFVGITRARQELQLSCAQRRVIQGTSRLGIASSFLMELPREEMEIYGPASSYGSQDEGGFHEEPSWVSEQPFDQTDVSDSAEQDWPQPAPDAPSSRSVPDAENPASASVMTAADMLASPDRDDSTDTGVQRVSPELFQQGMVVRHPERGLGKIMALSGEGDKRSATVQFFNETRPRSFVLSYCDLQSIRSS